MKKTILAVILNILFGGVGYIYLKEPTRLPLGIFLIYITVFEFIRNFTEGPNMGTQGNPFGFLPILSLLGSVAGTIILIIMAIDVYLIVKRQSGKKSSARPRPAKAV